MSIIDLQRRRPGPRADELLAGLQAGVAPDERVRWNESGHARVRIGQEIEDARITVAARLAELGDDWPITSGSCSSLPRQESSAIRSPAWR